MDNSDLESIDAFLKEIGVGRRALDDTFFRESHEACRIFQRTGVTVEDDEELCHEVMREFPCNVFGCKARFHNLIDFEIHYNGSHRYVCQECKKIRPNARLLEIHIQETHDNFFLVLADKQPMYQCYVSECDKKFSSPAERRDHCVTTHKFPKNFRYDAEGRKFKPEAKNAMEVEETKSAKTQNKKNSIDINKNRRTKMFARNLSHAVSTSTDAPSTRMEDAENIMTTDEISLCDDNKKVPSQQPASTKSALIFIPRQVAQRTYSSALTKNKKAERNVLESETMMDLAASLPE